MVGIICPLGWNRVNWTPKFPPSPPANGITAEHMNFKILFFMDSRNDVLKPFCLKFAWKRPSKFWVKASIVQPFHKFVVHSTFLLHFTLLRCTYILLWFSNDAYSSFKSCGNFFYYCGGIWLDSCKSLLPNYALSWHEFVKWTYISLQCLFLFPKKSSSVLCYLDFIILIKFTS